MRHICVSLVFIVFFMSAQAQFTFGPKAGLNISKISFTSPDFKASFKPGFYGGAFANYQINTNWAGQFEILYSGEGANEKGINNGGSGHINETYIQLPLLVQYRSKIGLFAEAGPQLGILAGIKETYGGSTESIKQYYHSADFRFPFGIGYEFSSSSKVKGLGVNARYSFNFSKINKETVGGESLKNQVISIGAFYKIPVKKFLRKK